MGKLLRGYKDSPIKPAVTVLAIWLKSTAGVGKTRFVKYFSWYVLDQSVAEPATVYPRVPATRTMHRVAHKDKREAHKDKREAHKDQARGS